MKSAIDETERRRAIQIAHNKKNKITPQTIIKKIRDITEAMQSEHDRAVGELVALDRAKYGDNLKDLLKEKETQMAEAVKNLDFETAALLRDEIRALSGDALDKKPRKR